MTNVFILCPVHQKNDASFKRKMMFFSNECICHSSVAKDPKTNIFVFVPNVLTSHCQECGGFLSQLNECVLMYL